MNESIYAVNHRNFSYFTGFGLIENSSNISSYYLVDMNASLILKFDDNWVFLTSQNITLPNYMVSVDEQLFITTNEGIVKMDQYLNVLQNYHSPAYVGISYNETNRTILVVSSILRKIDIFDLNLRQLENISLSMYSPPWSLEKYNDKLYVGTSMSEVLVIENKKVTHIFNVCMGITSYINSILVDQYEYMALVCGRDDVTHLYYTNGSWVGISWVVYSTPQYIGYDSKGRFIFSMTNELRIFQ